MEFNDSMLMRREAEVNLSTESDKQWMTLHCGQCNTVVGDGLSICGELTPMDSIMCLKVTNDVAVSDEMEVHKGDMAQCIYSPLMCRCCHSTVGKVIHSLPARLAVSRSVFLLNKANISCYILNSSSMVKASTLTFDLKPLRDNMREVHQKFKTQYERMLRVKSRMSDRRAACGKVL
ncbi:protein Mis18-beta [Sphaeramia orbicularis]|uniref:protein Mis18-beta n=1 Tax=Sphaeramia orbicularis TaxID=375764 RepID=UPI001180043B|nr:protein Mis18-beta-like [Sphaeramia orbicularis]